MAHQNPPYLAFCTPGQNEINNKNEPDTKPTRCMTRDCYSIVYIHTRYELHLRKHEKIMNLTFGLTCCSIVRGHPKVRLNLSTIRSASPNPCESSCKTTKTLIACEHDQSKHTVAYTAMTILITRHKGSSTQTTTTDISQQVVAIPYSQIQGLKSKYNN